MFDLDPAFDHARREMIPSYFQLGRYNEAIEVINRWAKREERPWVVAWRAAVYSRTGRAEEARRALVKLEQGRGSRADRTATLLVAFSGTGQTEQVIELLRKAYSEHLNAIVQIKVDPIHDPVRSDPRFTDLLRQVGLERQQGEALIDSAWNFELRTPGHFPLLSVSCKIKRAANLVRTAALAI